MAAFAHWYRRSFTTTGSLSDRLSSKWTVVFLLLLAVVAMGLQVFTAPIRCWVPAEFLPAHVDYANSYCWFSTFIVYIRNPKFPFDTEDVLPFMGRNTVTDKSQRLVYQWIPLIFLFQALLFKLPDILWKAGLSTLGMKIEKLHGLSDGYGNLPSKERKLVGKQLARYLYKYVDSSTLKGCPWGMITLLYIFIKCLYFVNVVTQFSLLGDLLSADYGNETRLYSNDLMKHLSNTSVSRLPESPAFPRTALCDFPVRKISNTQRYTVQCDIPINNWYHYISVLVWVWLLFMLVVTILSCCVDASKFILPICRRRYGGLRPIKIIFLSYDKTLILMTPKH